MGEGTQCPTAKNCQGCSLACQGKTPQGLELGEIFPGLKEMRRTIRIGARGQETTLSTCSLELTVFVNNPLNFATTSKASAM